MELQSEHNFGMRVTGRTRGRTGLKVVLRVTDPDAGQLLENLQELTDEIQIQVQHCGVAKKDLCKTCVPLSSAPELMMPYVQIFKKRPLL